MSVKEKAEVLFEVFIAPFIYIYIFFLPFYPANKNLNAQSKGPKIT